MLFSKIAATASILAYAFAVPIKSSETSMKLSKRSEGIHLVNCGTSYSAVVYCSNDSNCGLVPSSGNECVPGGGKGRFTWEGGKDACTFNTGTVFSWYINGTAQSDPNYQYVGSGDNGYTKFNIYKDDQHVMYNDGKGNDCKSIYYCLDA